MPVVQAPSGIMENIKARLEQNTQAEEAVTVSLSDYRQEKSGYFLFRKVLTAAAMVSLAAVLMVVINMLTPTLIKEPGGGHGQVVADARFSGKLELKANDIKGVDSMISRAIGDSGLTKSASYSKENGRSIYTLNCSRDGFNSLLAKLNNNWDKLDSASLFVNTKVFNENVEIDNVNPLQISQIVSQKDSDQVIQVAKDIAAENKIKDILPDRNKISSNGDILSSMKPIIVKYEPPVSNDNGEKTISFRIVLSK